MYFFQIWYYVVSVIGFCSILFFVVLLGALFDSTEMDKIGTRAYAVYMLSYLFGAVPLAATIADGFTSPFLYYLGCTTFPIYMAAEGLADRHVASKAAQIAASQAAGTLAPPAMAEPRFQTASPVKDFVAAPSTLKHDFDVPPQR